MSRDGRVRGITSLGAVPEVEFLAVMGRRWPTTLRPIKAETVRNEVY